MKSLNLLYIFSFALICCNQNNKKENKIIGVCQKIIVQDTINDVTINFLVSFKNTGSKDALIFTNFFHDLDEVKSYTNKGMFIKLRDKIKPIGQFCPKENFIIEPNKELKILYTFNEKNNDKVKFINSNQSIFSQIKLFKLFYSGKEILNSRRVKKSSNNYSNEKHFKTDFKINMDNVIIEYNNDFNIEDAIKLIEVKINGRTAADRT